MKRPLLLCLALSALPVHAHHGVASLGAAGLEGPGAPVETSSSATLPEGKWLAYLKVDHAESRKGILTAPDIENDYNQYWMLGLGYGFKPWLSGYVFQPYNIKKDMPGGYETRGFTDLTLAGVIGFKYDNGFMLLPANESLDDLRDWHFTVNLGLSLPTGNADKVIDAPPADPIDPGMSLGFGQYSFSYGLTATRQLSENTTAVFEVGRIRFRKYRYDDGDTMRFGTESRLNVALAQRLLTDPYSKFRLDGNLELNYLNLGNDVDNGVADAGSGGDMLYAVVGARLYRDNLSLGLAVKRPVWKELDEPPGSPQQGAEGKEKYRLIAAFSALF